jgi:class 3 adenylate cyclase/predicted ATPase
MTFDEMLDQAVAILQRRGRMASRALQRQFDLDDDALEDLKDAILYAYPVIDDGRGLVWTGDPAAPAPQARRMADDEHRFHAMLAVVTGLLRGERRVMYRTLTHLLGLDDALLEDIRKALTFQQLARDEQGEGLVWTGESSSAGPPALAIPSQTAGTDPRSVPSATPPVLPSAVAEAATRPDEATAPLATATAIPRHKPTTAAPEPVRSAAAAERRQLTVMFCDLADSTTLAQQLDPEDLREVMRAYQATAADVIQQYDGHIAQYLGDGLLVYFGWPRAHEDDVQRAAYAGLGIVEALTTTLNPRLEVKHGVQLTVRIGMHTGPVVVGTMGGGERLEQLATGETVNIAARLEALAASNTVLISQVTAHLVAGAFRLEDLGPHALKGVAEPMPVFRVCGPMEVHDDDAETTPERELFLVGRDEEVGLLRRRWEQAKAGLGQVVLLSGEAGIGKSSLVERVRMQVREEGLTHMAFRCSPYHQNSALYPVIEHVERALQVEHDEAPASKLHKLEQALQGSHLARHEAVPLLAALLSIPLPEARYPALRLTPQQPRHQTHDTLVAWLLDEAERQPVLAIWEDLHWADPSTLELLGWLVEQAPTVPMLQVLTFRPQFAPPWPVRSHMTPITLNRLERTQVEALISHLARGKALPAEVVEHLVTKTDGVPLFVEELTKMLLASTLLREAADHYVLTGPLSTVTIPDTLHDSLMARLDQMHTAKEVAQLGAVLGREFPYAMLQAIASQDDETLQASLAQLVGAELLYQRGRPPRATYMFKHALIQDAAYESLLRSTRQRIHQQIAEVLAAQFTETVAAQPELLAHHYTKAGHLDAAMGYWYTAGQRAMARSANQEAVGHLSQGIALLKPLPDTPEHLRHELDFQIALAQAVGAIKGWADPEMEPIYQRAYALCHDVGSTAQLSTVLYELGVYYSVQGNLSAARKAGEELLHVAQQEGDPMGLVSAYVTLGNVLSRLGDHVQALEHCEQGIALYRSQPHVMESRFRHDPGVMCLITAVLDLWVLGYTEQAVQRSQAAQDLTDELASPFNAAMVLSYTTRLHLCRKDWPETLRFADATIALSQERDITHWLTLCTIFRGRALAAQGQHEQGITLMQQGISAYRAGGSRGRLSHFLAMLAESQGQAGQVHAAREALEEALTLAEGPGEPWIKAELYRLKGELLRQASPSSQAEVETCFHQAMDVAKRQQAKSWELRAATSLARLWQCQDKRQEAYDLLASVYNWFTEGFDTADLQEAKALLEALSSLES